jgi:hypothetical protein
MSDTVIQISDIMSSLRDPTTGSISFQLGNALTGDVLSDDNEHWQQPGFASIPSLPSSSNATDCAQTVCIQRDDGNICIASRDVRNQAIYGSLKPGESSVYAAGPNGKGTGRVLLKDTGSVSTVSLFTQVGNTSSGNPVIIQLSSDEKVNIAGGSQGAITIDSNGINAISTSTMSLGAAGQLTLIGASLALNGGSVSIGANANVPIIMSDTLLTWISQVNAFCAAVSIAVCAVGSVLPGVALTVPTTEPIVSTSVFVAR